MKRAATHLFKRQSKNRAFFKIIELLLRFKTPRANPRADPLGLELTDTLENPTE